MTSFLRLNGIAVPVALNTAQLAPEAIGKNRRSANGTMSASRRLRKGGWKFSTAIKTAAEALAFRELLAGEGHVLSFDAQNYYTSQGMAPVSVAAGWSFTTSSPKFGAAMAQWTTGDAVWQFFPSVGDWTIAYWLNQSAAGWHHYVQTSSHVDEFGTTISTGDVWIDGVLTPGGIMLGFSGVTAGAATFGSVTASKIDDIVALPFRVPAGWPAQMFAWGNTGSAQPFSNLPLLTADGLFIEQGLKLVSVMGGDAPTGRVNYGSGVKNLHDFAFELAER